MNEMIYAAMDFWQNAPQVQVLGLSIHLYLLIAAIICATPLSHNLMERFRGLCRRVLDVHTAYSLDRVIKTVIVLILVLGALQLFCIGIIGEYVGKIFEQSKDRPIYIAKEVLK